MQHRNIPPPRDQRLPSLRRPYATVWSHCQQSWFAASGCEGLQYWDVSGFYDQRPHPPGGSHHPLPCLCLPLPSCLIYKLPISTYSGRKIAVLAKSTFAQNPKTWFRNVISQIARWLFSRRIADRRTLWRRLIMCVSSQVKDPTCGFTSVPIKNHCLTDRRFSIIRIWRWLEVEFINGVLVIEDYISSRRKGLVFFGGMWGICKYCKIKHSWQMFSLISNPVTCRF